MKTIAIIPARGGSKRLPGKNILPLGGLPLLAHSILYAKANSDIVDEVYVSTDDNQIKEVALTYGAKVIDRPASISGDLELTISSLQHVLKTIDSDVENVVLLQPTNPLRPVNLLTQCFQKYIEDNLGSLFTVSQNHHKLGKINNGTFVPFNYEIGQRSQDLEPLFFENGLLYISKSKLILEGKIISENAVPYIVNHLFANVDIDTKEDFEYAEYLLNKNKK
ncbi:acylneuraminate cytidylyltransferase family protein [Flavobacterium chungnamense]|uniref:Acylneuraminate cytidylyltransferase family protein n=1 Tax=Flavobacterium chungnamense TaxID=706182 RepID=A0ABP7UE46_9FLAO